MIGKCYKCKQTKELDIMSFLCEDCVVKVGSIIDINPSPVNGYATKALVVSVEQKDTYIEIKGDILDWSRESYVQS